MINGQLKTDKNNKNAPPIAKNAKQLSVIAPEYRYPEASKFIVKLFELGRVSTLPEAYDKFEEQLHRCRMEEAMKDMIELQKAQLAFLENRL